ncbi:MAG: OmpA family protein [Candidatus Marinimicrobia bacterium]|nr:OmpA family protein [Candidatus Neomarinimicrobiota bacterium]MCF7922152.1 OmpA family protein [Candidatus Neomarinimicrobiota bacterium]
MKITLIVLAILILGLGTSSIFLWNENQTAQSEINSLKANVNAMNDALEMAEIIKTEQIGKMQITYDSLAGDLRKEIELGQVKIKQAESKLSVSILDKVLFPSGKADISEEGQKILKRVGSILKNTKGKIIRVEGHTDNVPIHRNLQKQYPSNWELSSARASVVVKYLNENANIPGKRLRAVGMGPFHPVAKNSTAEGRKWNRRVEIALVPDPHK